MPPSLALLLWLIFLLALLSLDPANNSKTSFALWLPVIWMFIVGSRLPSQWLGGQIGQAAQSLEEGNPLDRAVYFAVIFLAIGILISRSFKLADFCARNRALIALISFALVSVVWSDFPFIAFKRWFRDLGSYLVVLVTLSDRSPLEAVRAVLRRVSYLLVPLSIVLIKYYPQIGKQYSTWTGADMYVGVTTSKNMLGLVCLVSGLYFFWDVVTQWPGRKRRRTKRVILVDVAFLAMTIWLLNLSNSATSRVCLVLGCVVITVAHTKFAKRRPAVLKVLIPASFCLYLILSLGFDMNGTMAGAVGRDPTLTDRTKIWGILLNMHTNPIVGTGYESFWLGPRLLKVWQSGLGGINEAHNGYLQVYLNLGLVGVFLLTWFLMASYRSICKRFSPSSNTASFALAIWTALVFYNLTEAAFEIGLLWMISLMWAITLPARAENRAHFVPPFDKASTSDSFLQLSFETTGHRR
jgi:exopolysaccharide production protein ExoQ